jgi:hypothetical protein
LDGALILVVAFVSNLENDVKIFKKILQTTESLETYVMLCCALQSNDDSRALISFYLLMIRQLKVPITTALHQVGHNLNWW